MEFNGHLCKDIYCCAFGMEKMANTIISGNLLGLLCDHEG